MSLLGLVLGTLFLLATLVFNVLIFVAMLHSSWYSWKLKVHRK
jgi:hypothetical protein